MNPLMWHKVAGISGMAALGLGTYGAHAFKPQNPAYNEVWRTASLYHLVHTAALVAAPMTKYPNFVSFNCFQTTLLVCLFVCELIYVLYIYQFGGLLTTGILAFSGT
ncbi:hypothetical protein LINPERHAP1_LOCUS42746 [Linum perenne]